MILAGDIGGTKTNVALYRLDGDRLALHRQETHRSADYESLWPLLERFLGADRGAVQAAAFGIAGPVVANRAITPNLAWSEVDGAELAGRLGLDRVDLYNDLVATALGIAVLPSSSIVELQAGAAQPDGTVAVIAAGTGLGMSALLPSPSGPVAMPSEGGHVDFAPRSPLEARLLDFMRAEIGGRVSVERVVSGLGIWAIYRFLRDVEGLDEPAALRERLAKLPPERLQGEAGGLIGALADEVPLCGATMDLFMDAYGAAAGNLALMTLATGGVYVGGGIAPKHLRRLLTGRFRASFLDKGRYRPTLEAMQIAVILEPEPALLGAARAARDRFKTNSVRVQS